MELNDDDDDDDDVWSSLVQRLDQKGLIFLVGQSRL